MRKFDFFLGALFGIAAVGIVEAIQHDAYETGYEKALSDVIHNPENFATGDGEHGETIDGGEETISGFVEGIGVKH